MTLNPFVPTALLVATLASSSWAQAPADANRGSALPATPVTHLAVGTVRSIDAAGRSATIDHRAIPSLNMPAMTMQFRLPPSSTVPVKVGDTVAFTFTASADGLTIGSVQPVGPAGADAGSRDRMGPSMAGMEHRGMQGMDGKQGMMMDGCPMMGGR